MQGLVVQVLVTVMLAAVASSQDEDAEFVPGGATRVAVPGHTLFGILPGGRRPQFGFGGRPQFEFGGRPQHEFGGDGPVVIVRRIPSVSSNRPSFSLIDILTRAFSGAGGDNICCGGSDGRFPVYDTDLPDSTFNGAGDDEGEPSLSLFPFPFPKVHSRPSVGTDEDEPSPSLFPFPFPKVPSRPSFGGFDDFFNSFIPKQPQGPAVSGFDFNLDDLPDNYNNKTHTVENIDGNRVEVNSTIKKDGNSFFQFHVVKFSPTNDSSGSSPNVPEDVDTSVSDTDGSSPKPTEKITSTPQPVTEVVSEVTTSTPQPVTEVVSEVTTTPYEDFGEKHGRVKRFSLRNFFESYFGGETTEETTEAPFYLTDLNSLSNHIDVNPNSPIGYETENEFPVLADLSGDTRVNYLARNVESEALVDDVEVFDWDLVREEARRNGFNNNLQSQPLRSESLKAHPMGILSVMSEPITTQTMRSQPIKTQSIGQQLSRSESLGLVDQSSRYQQRNQPIRYQSPRQHRMRSHQNSQQTPSVAYEIKANSQPIRHQRHRMGHREGHRTNP
ncbi:unnamed protein product [Meganyctiphanes norvegica]|uniref:Uncharacterized protein n=1 Tax=Meganyctiphanes norvegica TaxID=48144 RepID=A0AAV2QP92_MEGNR